ncbi:MAG: hypothetical protein KAS23_07110, partial [Anaerohalosphaera sp.]|nr:hypothetical protein [Anaerohalosphaera sp.]
LNETMTALLRVIVPFGSLLIVAFMTRPQDKPVLDKFYGKMRTPVSADHDEDARQMGITNNDPTRFDHLKIFPNSNWEFRKWNRKDWVGQAWVFAAMLGIVLLTYSIIATGR